jgi:hypothetical protein
MIHPLLPVVVQYGPHWHNVTSSGLKCLKWRADTLVCFVRVRVLDELVEEVAHLRARQLTACEEVKVRNWSHRRTRCHKHFGYVQNFVELLSSGLVC